MPKARASGQFAFAFDPPPLAAHPAALAGTEAQAARMVGEVLNSDTRSREVIAAEMSVLLDGDVSRAMLDAWSAPGKPFHSISFARMLALIAVTKRFDLLDRELRQIGAALLVGPEIHTARVGHLKSQLAAIKAELAQAERLAQPITREGAAC